MNTRSWSDSFILRGIGGLKNVYFFVLVQPFGTDLGLKLNVSVAKLNASKHKLCVFI